MSAADSLKLEKNIDNMLNESDLKLELVQVLFRHGARTPSRGEAKLLGYTDPKLYHPWNYEQLTNVGKRQAYKLGCNLRKRYNEFLGATCDHDKLEALSSDYDRTKMSLQLVLAGLFPPKDEFIWNPDLNWTPIPFQHTSRKTDALFRSHISHSLVAMIRETKNPELLEKVSKHSSTLELLLSNGMNYIKAPSHYFATGAFNVLTCHKFMNIALPAWCTEGVYNNIMDISISGLNAMSTSLEMKKINGGPLVKKFTENLKKDSSAKKLYLYSGHDLNIAAFFNANNIKGFCYPGFSSSIILETFRDSQNNRYVRLLWWSSVEDENPVALKIENLNEICPLEDYLKQIESVIPSDDELFCISNDL